MSYKARCPQCDEWMEVERVDNGVMMVWHGVHCGWGQAYFADEDVYATSQPAKPQGRMHACDIPGCVSCGNPEDATSQEGQG